jgi:hypothetical protein
MNGIGQEMPKTQNGSLNVQPETFEPGKARQTEGEITKGNCPGNERRIEKNPWQPGNSQKGTDDAKEFNVTGANPSEGERNYEHGDSDDEPQYTLYQ